MLRKTFIANIYVHGTIEYFTGSIKYSGCGTELQTPIFPGLSLYMRDREKNEFSKKIHFISGKLFISRIRMFR